jgi:enoyl-CoA hydratase/carnithine racemase
MSTPIESKSNQPVLLRADADGVCTLTLNRSGARNALSRALVDSLQFELDAIAQDKTVRVVVITGTPPAFCAGHDMREIRANPTQAFYEATFAASSQVMKTITALPQPVIARVDGTATAAGCQLVAACDLAVASEIANFATPGVNIGLFCSTPMVPISRNVGRKAMMEMLLLGETVEAEEALRLGLVNRVVPAADLDATVAAMSAKIVAKSPLVLEIGKEAFYRQLDMPLEDAYAYCSAVMTRNMMAHDAEEGIDAFIQKREPKWEGR